MKTIEEKAKAYDEAIERAKKRLDGAKVFDYKDEQIAHDIRTTTYDIFPELKESENERIREDIISLVNKWWKDDGVVTPNFSTRAEMLTWLEKQGEQEETLCDKCKKEQPSHSCQDITALGRCALEKQSEQKPADKVESHFHIEKGKWYMCIKNNVGMTKGNVYYGISDGYIIDNNGMKHNCNNWAVFQRYLRLWTIKDAKDGDVLACESGWTCIFKTLVNDETFSSYCFMDNTKWFCETGSESHTLNKEFMKAYNGEIKPAAKEQRDLLFQKMKEAGYEWDAEKKELKRIIDEKQIKKNLQDNSFRRMFEQKPAWSEEDEKNIEELELELHDLYNKGLIKWETKEKFSTWFKSIKSKEQPERKWKPTEKQMNALWVAKKRTAHYYGMNNELEELYDGLKKEFKI